MKVLKRKGKSHQLIIILHRILMLEQGYAKEDFPTWIKLEQNWSNTAILTILFILTK